MSAIKQVMFQNKNMLLDFLDLILRNACCIRYSFDVCFHMSNRLIILNSVSFSFFTVWI